MRFLYCALCLVAFSAYADHRGGNGGDSLEPYLNKKLVDIAAFLDSSLVKDFGITLPEDMPKLSPIAKKVSFTIVAHDLKDKFGNKRCYLNFPETFKIFVDERCFERMMEVNQSMNLILGHELLNLAGFELPDDTRSSVYRISEKLYYVPDAIISKSERFIVDRTCKMYIINELQPSPLNALTTEMLWNKGYTIVKNRAEASLVLNQLKDTIGITKPLLTIIFQDGINTFSFVEEIRGLSEARITTAAQIQYFRLPACIVKRVIK